MDENAVLKRFSVKVDLKRTVNTRPFEIVEGDTGNVIEAAVFDDGEPVDLTGTTVIAAFSSSAGPHIQQGETVTIDDNVVTIALLPSSAGAGLVECELQIYSSEDADPESLADMEVLVTTAKFTFNCRSAIAGESAVESSPEFPLLAALTAEVGEAEAERAEAEAQRQANEAERIRSETLRSSAENMRRSAEASRATAEQARAAAEAERQANEAQRQANEAVRQANESDREDAESVRAAAEAERVEAEAEREAAVAELLESAGMGVLYVTGAPTAQTPGEKGRIVFDVVNGKAYICTAVVSGSRVWKRFAFDPDWEEIRSFTLTSDSTGFTVSSDSNGTPFEYDELRVVLIGCMRTIMGVNISLNGSTEYIRDNNFMNKDCADPSKNMTVFYARRMENGFAITERLSGGVTEAGGYSTAKATQAAFLKLGTNAPYSSVKIEVSSNTGRLASGTVIQVHGRNLG